MFERSELEGILSFDSIKENEPLSEYTSFKTGGPARFLCTPADEKELSGLIRFLKAHACPYVILGNGSNVLVSDEGFDGAVILIRDTKAEVGIAVHGESATVSAAAGCALAKLAYEASRAGFAGLEFAAGIPGSLGGAVVMNAGAYGGEIKDCLKSVRLMDDKGSIFTLSADELELGYRHSIIPERNYIVLAAEFELKRGSAQESLELIRELNARRKEKQPLEYPSAGSTFKRPEGYFAGKLIEDAGLKGFRVGDAEVSKKHSGFVINTGNASSSDIYTLICSVQRQVKDKFGVMLEPEVKLLGEFKSNGGD